VTAIEMTARSHHPRDGVDGWELRTYSYFAATETALFVYDRVTKGAVLETVEVRRAVRLPVAVPRQRRRAA